MATDTLATPATLSDSQTRVFKNFLGRPQNMVALQKWMSEEFQTAGESTKAGGK